MGHLGGPKVKKSNCLLFIVETSNFHRMLLFTIESHMYNIFSVNRGPFGVAAHMVTILKLHAAVALNRSRSTLVPSIAVNRDLQALLPSSHLSCAMCSRNMLI